MDSNVIGQHLLASGYPLKGSVSDFFQLLDFPTESAMYIAIRRGKCPVRVRHEGRKVSILLADVADTLSGGAGELVTVGNDQPPAEPTISPATVRSGARQHIRPAGAAGRPNAVERDEASRLGVTVAALRQMAEEV